LECYVKRARLIGGVICLAVAALVFLLGTTSISIPPAITLTIVGVVLVATARKKNQTKRRIIEDEE